VYVADSGTNLVYSIATNGAVTNFATNDEGLLNSPQGVAVDSAGNVYVANTGANTILGITPGDKITTVIAGTAGLTGSADGLGSAARFDSPIGLAVDASGNVYVADVLNNTIRKGTPYTAQTAVLTLTTSPSGLPIEANGINYASTPQVFALAAGSVNTNIATTTNGYTFTNWTVGGTVVSTSSNYTFTLGSNETLVANFLTTRPLLSITRSNGVTFLFWPSSATGFTLDSATNLRATNWVAVTNTPAVSGGHFIVSNTWPDQTRFFQLILQ
jgi:sugar lactone lactonase YvrE